MSTSTLAERCREEALKLGFEVCGFASININLRKDYYNKWIAEGKHGEMSWMERNSECRVAPEKIIPGAKSIISLGYNYYQEAPEQRAKISTYALGKDYHNIIYKKLKKLCAWMRTQGGEQKPYVDTGPVLEKPIAANAGIGWMGKNTVIINKDYGPWLFLGTIISTLELKPDDPSTDHCGNCTKCIDVCPTHAITSPYQLDASRCIAYLTIEHQGAIPIEFRKAIHDRVFGCDDCLSTCPWNRFAKQTRESKFTIKNIPDIRETLSWNETTFKGHFSGTPISRLKLTRWKRNACVVIGNIGTTYDLPLLQELTADEDPIIAEHASWAVKEINARLEVTRNSEHCP